MKSRTRPNAIVTIADQSPPPESKSVTKYQEALATTKTSSGKRKACSATAAATTVRSSSTSSQKWKPLKLGSASSGSQPNQSNTAPTKTTNAATELRAKRPAVTKWPFARNP
jgi:hypothetical protein